MSESQHTEHDGEILKSNVGHLADVRVGMDVTSIDGEKLGTVKEIKGDTFLLNRPLARDLWVPLSAVMATQQYNSNFRRGMNESENVVLNVCEAHVDSQGWSHA
jgi:hypothetical protein